jgi:succinoglycan biosynthesis protein ExoL
MDIDNLKVLSVLPVLGQPRHAKRITMLQQAGFSVEAVALERDYHIGRLPDCPVERLGKIAHGRYLQRFLKLVIALPAMRRAMRRNCLVYTFGLDMAIITFIAGMGLQRPIILEIGDIRSIQVASGLTGYFTRLLDRYVVNASWLLVATSQGFVDGYYRKWLNTRTPALVLENKLESSMAEAGHIEASALMEGKPLVDRPLRIGYFGLLRCGWSWQVLETLALSRPSEVEIVVAGYPTSPVDLPERAAKLINVDFRGEFSSPNDLPALYGKVDLVWGCYPYPDQGDWNWRWARTNRFYECCFFQKPIISLASSGDASEVDRYKIGMVIHDQSIEKVVDVLSGISPGDLTHWQDNLSKLPRNVYVYTTETDELKNALEGIVRDHRGCGHL